MRRFALGTALLFLLWVAPGAKAVPDPVGTGTATLRLDKSFLAFCKRDKVKLSVLAPATLEGGKLALPLQSGAIDPTTGRGKVEAEGALVFSGARKTVPLRHISLRTERSPLVAKVGGSQLKVASSPKLSSRREGFGSSFTAKQLKLSAKVATRLDKKLRPKVPFKEGQLLGTLMTATQPLMTAILEENRATLVFDPGFVAKLESLFVSMNPIFPAEHQGSTFSFPIIAGGQLAPDASQGTLRSGGEVELLQLGGGQLFWHEQWIDLGARVDSAEANVQPSPPYAGKTGRIGLFDANTAAAQISSNPSARTISVSNLPLTLQAETAKTLNEVFAEGKEEFRAGEEVGVFSFAAQGE
jgi:hypothetical protein